MIIVNGEFADRVAVAERALHYGDGCFTTMAFKQKKVQLWPQHLSRLQDNCQRLGINYTNWPALFDSLHALLERVDQSEGVVKIIISRGTGGRGYSPLQVSSPSFIMSSHVQPAHYSLWQKQGIKLGLSPISLARQPLLAGIKHLNRLEQVLIKQALDTSDYDEALVCDTQGNIVEASAANVFWCDKGQWFTPSLEYCGVKGVMRNVVCELIASRSEAVVEVTQQFSADFTAEQMFICNALMGLVPVNSLHAEAFSAHWSFEHGSIHQLQLDLMQYLQNQ